MRAIIAALPRDFPGLAEPATGDVGGAAGESDCR
jgi:hypothetical protein